jgi:mRNA-degrading endonuclease YafQ of YafQ-DinJ toxin-antitoxin module
MGSARQPAFTGQFKRDFRRIRKRGWNVERIVFVRTGSHADLFR